MPLQIIGFHIPYLTSKTRKCDEMAPIISPIPITEPKRKVNLIKSKTPVTSSIVPIPILPQGSTTGLVNNSTLSGCPVKFKFGVCTNTSAATRRTAKKIIF